MCEGYRFRVDYFSEDGKIREDLFSDEAECLALWIEQQNYIKNRDGEYQCRWGEWKKNCPKKNRRLAKKSISYNQMRKFYEEVLNFKTQLENGKEFRDILPYFKMLKAKANVAYERDVINSNFKRFIDENVDYIGADKKRFDIFCTYFEAVLAYAKGTLRD